MTGILPTTAAGGISVQDGAGNATNPADVTNAYIPGPDFTFTCDQTALPDNCNARIFPSQINAINSEMIALAECFDPDGQWDCNSLQNLCTNFNTWVAENIIASNTVESSDDSVTITPSTAADGGILYDLTVEHPANNNVTSDDDTVTINEATGADGQIIYDLSVGCETVTNVLEDTNCVPADTCEGATSLAFYAKRDGVMSLIDLDEIYAQRILRGTPGLNITLTQNELGNVTENTGANRLDFNTNPAHLIDLGSITVPDTVANPCHTHAEVQIITTSTINNSDGDNNAVITLQAQVVYTGPIVGFSIATGAIAQSGVNTDQDDNDREGGSRAVIFVVPITHNGDGTATIGGFELRLFSNSAGGVSDVSNYVLGANVIGLKTFRAG